jgi:hypothetical protein
MFRSRFRKWFVQDIRALSGIARSDSTRSSWAAEEQRYVTALRMNSLMRELAYTLVHLRHEHNKLTLSLAAGDSLVQFSRRPITQLSAFTLPEVPRLLQEYVRLSSRVRIQPMFLNISETHGSRFFFNKQMVVCDECYERCMLSDIISVVPCIASANHFVANEVAIMRSIEDHFDSSAPASALPSVLLNIFDGAVDSIWNTDYYLEAQKASKKLKFAKEALQNMMALLSMRRPQLHDRVHEDAFSGLVNIQQQQISLRAELAYNLSLNFIARLRSSTAMPWLSPTDRQTLIARYTLDNNDRLSLGEYGVDHVRDSVHALQRLHKQRYFTHPESLFKECAWLRASFPSDPANWTEFSCARALQHVETQYEEIGGILEFCRMAAEVLNREGELLKLRKHLLVEHNDVQRRAMEARDRVRSSTAQEASASALLLVERCRLAESKCSRLLVRQQFRALLGRVAHGENIDLTCDLCSVDLQRDWVLLRCCHKFCAACWNSTAAALQAANRCCSRCHLQLSRHDIFESSRHKFGSEMGLYDLARWSSCHPLNGSSANLSGLGHKELFRLTSDFSTVTSQICTSSTAASRQSGPDHGTRLNVCIRRIRCINEQSGGLDKVVVASFSFGSGQPSAHLKDALVNALKREGISAVCVSGVQAQQAEAIRRFDEDPDIRVLLLDMHSSYSGVTLTAANHLFLLDAFHNISETQQIIARISRQGQRKPCFVYHMCCDASVEEAILVKRERKTCAQQLQSDIPVQVTDRLLAALPAGSSLLGAPAPLLSTAFSSLHAATSVRPLAVQTDDSAAAAEPAHAAAGAAGANRHFAETRDAAESYAVETRQGPRASPDGSSVLGAPAPLLSTASSSLPAATSVRPLAVQADDSAAAAEPAHAAAGAAGANRHFAETRDAAESNAVETRQGPRASPDGSSVLGAPAPLLSTASPSLPAAGTYDPFLTPFANHLKANKICDDAAKLTLYSALGSKNGVHDIEDLFELSEEDIQVSVEELKMNPAQMRKLFKLVKDLDTISRRKAARFE